MEKKGDLSDSEHGLVVGARWAFRSSETPALLGFSHPTISEFTENGPKKGKCPVLSSAGKNDPRAQKKLVGIPTLSFRHGGIFSLHTFLYLRSRLFSVVVKPLWVIWSALILYGNVLIVSLITLCASSKVPCLISFSSLWDRTSRAPVCLWLQISVNGWYWWRCCNGAEDTFFTHFGSSVPIKPCVNITA